jgi:hypothetical protein
MTFHTTRNSLKEEKAKIKFSKNSSITLTDQLVTMMDVSNGKSGLNTILTFQPTSQMTTTSFS